MVPEEVFSVLKRMKVEGLLFDPRSGMYILLLKSVHGSDTLPIWIGKPEADSIALTLGKVSTPRPLTHDLIRNVIEGMRGQVKRVVVSDLVENTYYAFIEVEFLGGDVRVDARPSDAVAVALRMDVPIYVEPHVIASRGGDELEGWLKNLKPEDFGNVM